MYVADDSGALRIVDISNPGKPRETGHVDLPEYNRGVAVDGRYAYLAAGWQGLVIIDVSDSRRPLQVADLKSVGYVTDVHKVGSLAVVVGHRSGLRVVDVSNPLQPLEIGHAEMPGQPHGVYIADRRAYVVSLDSVEEDGVGGLTIFDLSDPTAPKRLSFQKLIYGAERVWVEGKYA